MSIQEQTANDIIKFFQLHNIYTMIHGKKRHHFIKVPHGWPHQNQVRKSFGATEEGHARLKKNTNRTLLAKYPGYRMLLHRRSIALILTQINISTMHKTACRVKTLEKTVEGKVYPRPRVSMNSPKMLKSTMIHDK